MMRKVAGIIVAACCLASIGGAGQETFGAPPEMRLHVDASDIGRKLVKSRMEFRGVEPGELVLWYPKYVPGNHAASGPIQNVAHLNVTDCDDHPLFWNRDPEEPRRITVHVPVDCDGVAVHMTYIASDPWHMSRSSDSYGFPNFGAVNWNTVVWYPAETNLREARVEPTLTTTAGHGKATSLGREQPGLSTGDGPEREQFARTPFMELIDAPVIFGEHLNSYEIEVPEGVAPHFIHLVASNRTDATLPDWMREPLSAMVEQAQIIFGRFPRDEFHFLTMVDDSLRFGLEHGESTFISARNDAFSGASEPTELEGGMEHLTVIPHEYVHVWCGKLCAPEGLVRSNYHDPVDGSLLWVYEGLTTYYTQVLGVRSGMMTSDEYRQNFMESILRYEQRAGRLWRSVQDTARDVINARNAPHYWPDLRRTADYYGEGALFWMEADAIIRRGTSGARSLDDFCLVFFDVPVRPVGEQATFSREDVVRTLGAIYDGEDWDALIRSRIEQPRESLELDYLLHLLGYEQAWSEEPSRLQKKRDGGSGLNLRTSLGITIDGGGVITGLVPGSPADGAGLGRDMTIIGVESWRYSRDRMLEAMRQTPETGRVDLLVAHGDHLMRHTIRWSQGLRYPRLERQEGEPDVLAAIESAR